MALMCDPQLLIADEPTTALDVTVQAQILRLLATPAARPRPRPAADHPRPRHRCPRRHSRVSVMYAGEVVERASTAELFANPRHPYTQGLLRCVPVPGKIRRDEPLGSIPGTVPRVGPGFRGLRLPRPMHLRRRDLQPRDPAPSRGADARLPVPAARMTTVAIEVRNVAKTFKAGKRTVVAVDEVSFSVPIGGVLGIVGEIRLRQVHARPPDPRPAPPDSGEHRGRRPAPGRHGPQGPRAADPAGVPGPVRLAQSAGPHPRHRRACRWSHRAPLARSEIDRTSRRDAGAGSASAPRWAAVFPPSCRAASASGSRSPARWCCAAHRGVRRADLRARRLGAGADPEPAGPSCGATSTSPISSSATISQSWSTSRARWR